MYTQQTPSIHRENDENYGSSNNVEDNECAKVTQPPLYSVPDTTQGRNVFCFPFDVVIFYYSCLRGAI